jgi:hypothetical protein
MPNRDCYDPDNQNCGGCMSKFGLWIPTFGGHNIEVVLAPKKLAKMYSAGGAWGGDSLFENLRFINFNSKTN